MTAPTKPRIPTTVAEIDDALREAWSRLQRARRDGNGEACVVYGEQLNRLLGWRKQLTDRQQP